MVAVLTSPRRFDFEYWGGGASRTGAQNLAAWDRAVDDLISRNSSYPGNVVFGPGVHDFDGTLTVDPSGTGSSFGSVGMTGVFGSTVLRRTGSFTLVDYLGTHASTSTTSRVQRWSWNGVTFDGNNSTGGTTYPLIRMYYCQEGRFNQSTFRNTRSLGIDMVEVWDTWFSQCFIRNMSGRDAASPAVYIRSSTSATSGTGHGADSSNNIYFNQCRFEHWRDGAIWVEPGRSGAEPPQWVWVNDCKFENHANSTQDSGFRSPGVWFNKARYPVMHGGQWVIGGRDLTSTPASATDGAIVVSNCRSATLHNLTMTSASDMLNTEIDSYIHMDGATLGSNESPSLRNIAFLTQTASVKPVTACIKFSGTNSDVDIEHVRLTTNTGSATLASGTVTSLHTEPAW